MVLPCLLYFCPFALAEVGHEADNGVVVPDVGVVEHLNKVRFDGTLFNEPYLLGKSGTKGGSGFVESLSAGQLNSKPVCQEGSDKSSNNSEASGDNGQIVRGEFYFHGIKFTIWSYVLFLLIAYIPIECVIAWIFSKFLFSQRQPSAARGTSVGCMAGVGHFAATGRVCFHMHPGARRLSADFPLLPP